MICSSCGTPAVRDAQRFCQTCGAELTATAAAAAEPEPDFGGLWADEQPTAQRPRYEDTAARVYPPPPPPSAGQAPAPSVDQPPVGDAKRSGAGWRRALVIALVVLVAASIGIGGTLLLSGGDDDTVASDRTSGDDRDDRDEPGAQESVADDAEPTASSAPEEPESSATESVSAGDFACWDGSMADGASACPALKGEAGMTWVFPRSGDPSCVIKRGAINRARESTCFEYVGNDAVEVHYSQWRNWDTMNQNYLKAASQNVSLRADVNTWAVNSDRASGKVAVWLDDRTAPYSVTIYAADLEQAAEVFRKLNIRDAADLAGKG